MHNSLLKITKRLFFTLRFSMLSIFVSLFVIALMLSISINYKYDAKVILDSTNSLMNQVSVTLNNSITDQIRGTIYQIKSSNNEIKNVINTDNINTLINYTASIANDLSLQQAFYWGDEKGTFVNAEYDIPGAIKNTVTSRVIDRSINPPIGKYIYRDINGKIISVIPLHDLSYDPRNRPWYIAAKKAKTLTWTNVYLYEPNHHLGITLASPVYKESGELRGVLGIDIGLHWLSRFIGEQKVSKNTKIIIVADGGEIIAYPELYDIQKNSEKLTNIKSLNIPWLTQAFDIFKHNNITKFSFNYQGHVYLANFNTISQFPELGWTIGVVAPVDDFTLHLKWLSLLNAGIEMIILLISVLLVWIFVSRIVRPINRLVAQTNKIKRFQLEDEEQVRSRIKEVNLLSAAISSLRSGLRSFQSYVPASLVRQLIQTGENAKIGGNKRPLTILFTDIRNFTTIAESVHPDLLMEQICEYFDEMSKIIVKEKGTIDKYIGDSIMAFWGAPLIIKNPTERAARAALKCIHRSDQLNQSWALQGKPTFLTNIGIHLGEAIVGNVGSSERLNYTALGDPINVASRLEGINKLYNTKIIVSRAVYNLIKDKFILRKIDRVAVKGKVSADDIYELMADNESQLQFDLHTYLEYFDKAFNAYQHQNWDDAITLFTKCLDIIPDDNVALVFIKRCLQFKANPPIDWDGVWRITE